MISREIRVARKFCHFSHCEFGKQTMLMIHNHCSTVFSDTNSNFQIMEDLGFFPYPSSFGSPFDDVIMDPGPTSFFLKEESGEEILLGQGLDQLQNKLDVDWIKNENNGSPINVDDDWLMKDLSGNFLCKYVPFFCCS